MICLSHLNVHNCGSIDVFKFSQYSDLNFLRPSAVTGPLEEQARPRKGGPVAAPASDSNGSISAEGSSPSCRADVHHSCSRRGNREQHLPSCFTAEEAAGVPSFISEGNHKNHPQNPGAGSCCHGNGWDTCEGVRPEFYKWRYWTVMNDPGGSHSGVSGWIWAPPTSVTCLLNPASSRQSGR